MSKILVVEDENNIGEIVEINLKLAHHTVTRVTSAEAALEVIDQGEKFDVALLDIMLPGMNGIFLCEQIRKNDEKIGIIMLSAKSQEHDKVTCLSVWADDYITKPFGVQELLARVESLLRRVNKETGIMTSDEIIQSGPFTLDLKSRVLYKNKQMIDLTSVEFGIMELFFRNEGTALVREKILEGVWGENYFGDVKIVDVNIRRLRIKIEEDPSNPQYIVTIWGYGYRWTV
ncbi:MAG: response regulator transcription factor [Oscillospiraceae bacterium]|nr:response regulator transcription factor [Oscillospiraceae bacterium]MBP1570729.1 response regulator transcription factor [Oscillospiraceae bacterium]MBQ5313063.1 response regulator transcription factor [Oscillospiraceae bacterium]MBQ5324598.1 response regulator transcription factor [Oscillospiraceae bacterium]